MPTSFLQDVLNHIDQAQHEWRNVLLIFPNKRPASFLKKALIERHGKAVWSPEILSIDDFITQRSKLFIPDNLTLILELWEVYKPIAEQFEMDTSLDAFFPIGETMLKDFNAVDNQLVKGEALFANIAELRELEERFEPTEQLEELRKFWVRFSDKEISQMKNEFRKLWQQLGSIYASYCSRLQEKNWSYRGMALRKLIDNESAIQNLGYELVGICGFNAISTAEASLFEHLAENQLVKFFFDVDAYYHDDGSHEAGTFSRRNLLRFKNSLSKNRHLSESAKSIEIVGTSGITGMAQIMSSQLSELPENEINEETAVVLADENALQPVLSALPNRISPVNITMGYPVKNTPYFNLLLGLLQLYEKAKPSRSQLSFYHKDVITLLNSGLFAEVDDIYGLSLAIERKNLVYLSSSWLLNSLPTDRAWVFSSTRQPRSLMGLLLQAVEFLLQTEEDAIGREFLIALHKQLIRFQDVIFDYTSEIELETLIRLFRRVMAQTRVPFEGEPLLGVQIMGLLETRCLDFKRVIILSVNEGVLPKGVHYGSLIPFSIRQHFGLATFIEDDAIYAYHFYRLLQRAQKVHLLYNTDSTRQGKGEASRFVRQLEHEFKDANPDLDWSRKVLSFSSDPTKYPAVSVAKNDAVLSALSRYETGADAEVQRAMSPSALVAYMKSPLQFYFRYIVGLKEREDVLEDIDAITLGHIVHGTLESLYTGHLNQQIVPQLTEYLKKEKLPKELEFQLRDKLNLSKDALVGTNILLFTICQKLCENVLDVDARTKGLHLLRVEFDELSTPFEFETSEGPKTILLKGQFDRIDEVNGAIRIIDYKTGKVEIPRNEELLFKDPKYAAAFQALFYTYVYLSNYPNRQVQPVIYHLKSTTKLVRPLRDRPIRIQELQAFEEGLRQFLANIWDTDQSFRMETPDKELDYLMVKPMV